MEILKKGGVCLCWELSDMENTNTNTHNPLIIPQQNRRRGRPMKILLYHSLLVIYMSFSGLSMPQHF